MQRVAADVGVRPPSLYKRVRDRGHLIHLLVNDIASELAERLDTVARGDDPSTDLRALADALRAFAHEQPAAYGLLFAPLPAALRVDPELNERAAAAVLRTASALAGPEHGLEAARTVVAWANGFVSMELTGAFRLGGSPDAAFRYGIDRLARALALRPEEALEPA